MSDRRFTSDEPQRMIQIILTVREKYDRLTPAQQDRLSVQIDPRYRKGRRR